MFGQPPTGFGAPAAPAGGGFGKAPAAGGFGATAPPAAGGFGAPAAGGFGKAPAPGGFGAPAPAAGGFGAPAPAAGGFGAPAPAAGFGKAPAAAGGFGAPAPGGFGKAPVAPGGFGAPAAGGFGAPAAGGFGAPAAGGFGAPAAGGFGKAPVGAPAQPQLVYTGITGPGYTAPNTPSWVTGTDLTQITDDTLVSKLPQNLQQHLGQLLEFGAKERHARAEIQQVYQHLQSDSNKKGLRSLQDRLDALTTKSGSLGVDQLIVQAYHRDKTAKQLLQRAKETEEDISNYSRDVWDRIHREGTEYWQQKLNLREGPSELLRNMLENTAQVMAQVDEVINTLAAALAPLQRHNGRRTTAASGSRSGATSMAPPPTSRLLQPHSSAVNLYGAGSGTVSSPNASTASGNNYQLFDFNVTPVTTAPADPIELVQESLQQTMSAFLNLGDNVSGLHSRANQVRDHVVRYYGETEAEDLFSKKDKFGSAASDDDIANDNEADEFVTITIGDTLKGRVRGNELIGGSRVSKAMGAGRSLIPGIAVPRHSMRYDPTLEQGTGNVGTVAGAAAPAIGGFGAAPAAGGFGKAPAAGGFGAPAPAAGGFGAPAAAPGAGGFGAPAAAPAGGLGAPAAAPAAGGFGAPAATPAPGGFGAPPAATAAKVIGFGAAASPGGGALANQQGLGATPAPAGFGGASPASGATPSAIGQSFGGFSPSPTGPVTFGSSPNVATPNASPDERPRGKTRR
jgi:hypothetical protein